MSLYCEHPPPSPSLDSAENWEFRNGIRLGGRAGKGVLAIAGLRLKGEVGVSSEGTEAFT